MLAKGRAPIRLTHYGDIPNEDVVVRVFTQTALFVLAGAFLVALVNAIYDWLNRGPERPRSNLEP